MQITYIIQKSRRRSISVSVLPDNRVLVKAPYRTTEQSIQEFLVSKKAWITKQIEKQKSQIQKAEEMGFLLLVLMLPEILDSVVVHELCHRKHMNHSKEFYAEIDKVFPDYKWCDKWLKENGGVYMKRVKNSYKVSEE